MVNPSITLHTTHYTLLATLLCPVLSLTPQYLTCRGSTAQRAVRGPLDGITMGSASRPCARRGLSVITYTRAPRALTSSAAVRMCDAWSSSRISMMQGVWPFFPLAPSISAKGPWRKKKKPKTRGEAFFF